MNTLNQKNKLLNKYNPAYIGPRNDILELIPNNISKILDVGCSIGELGKKIKQRNFAEVTGIEIDPNMAAIAKEKLDRVIIEDIERLDLFKKFKVNYFDCIILSDVLEHLKEPWTTLKNLTKILNVGGTIISSIPNIRHYATIGNLIFMGNWPYRDRGIHDINHLRFFTLKTIKEMFDNTGLRILNIKRNYRIIEKPHPYNRFSRYFVFPFIKEFMVFQYLVVATKSTKVLNK
jgi:methionine biosynthesis protein MetW